MEPDMFCRPVNFSYNGDHYSFTCVADSYCIKPNTGNSEIDKYFIYVTAWYGNDYFRDDSTMPTLTFTLEQSDKKFSSNYKLEDIEEFYNSLNMYMLEDNIMLHNYCCKRLREEINRCQPELDLVSNAVKSARN